VKRDALVVPGSLFCSVALVDDVAGYVVEQ
jgi:hypothetical protein